MRVIHVSLYIFLIFILICPVYSQIRIIEINNSVQVLLGSKDEKEWKSVYKEILFFDQDKIQTGIAAHLIIRTKSYDIKIYENSIVTIDKVSKENDNQTEIYLHKGRLRARNNSLVPAEKLIIRSINSEFSPKGSDFAVESDGAGESSVYVFEGTITAVNPNDPEKSMDVQDYEMSRVKGNEPPYSPEIIPQAILDQYNVSPPPEVIKPVNNPVLEKEAEPPGLERDIKPKRVPVKQLPNIKPPETAVKKTESKPEEKPKPAEKSEQKPEKKKEPWCKDPKLKLNFNFDISYSEFNKMGHIMFALMPELIYCRIGAGFYLPVYYNYKYNFMNPKKSWYNHNEWDFVSPGDSAHDLWIKFIYIRYGQKGDPLYIRIGGLNSVTFGNGFIMSEYNNMLNFPKIRKLGLQFDYIYNNITGIETVIGDMNSIRLYGGRFLIFPFWFDPELGLLNKIQIGTTAVYDRIYENDNKVINWGFDLGLPLVKSDIFNLHYGIDWATFSAQSTILNNKEWVGSGNYGFSSGFRGNLSFLIYRAEYRFLKDSYIPEYFDTFYDLQREEKYKQLMMMYLNPLKQDLNGYFVNAGLVFGGAGEFGFTFQEYYKDGRYIPPNKAKLYLTLNKGVIPRFYGTAAYHKLNVAGFSGERGMFGKLYTPDTILTFDGAIQTVSFIYIKISYRKTFEYDEHRKLQSYETYSTGISIGF